MKLKIIHVVLLCLHLMYIPLVYAHWTDHTTTTTKWQATVRPTPHPTRRPTLKPTNHPTKRPTWRPTNRPTRSPTAKPTHHPSRSPTVRPSDHPSSSPTLIPTSNPSHSPTQSPTYEACDEDYIRDIVFVVANSCEEDSDDCAYQQSIVSQVFQGIKGAANPRIAYIECDGNIDVEDNGNADDYVVISMDNNDYNHEPVTSEKLMELFSNVDGRTCTTSNRNPLGDCINRALEEFTGPSSVVRKLIVFSTCDEIGGKFSAFGDFIYNRIINEGVIIYYYDFDNEDDDYIESFTLDICKEPTDDPTPSPTSEPSVSPSDPPTPSPSLLITEEPTTVNPSPAPTKIPSYLPTLSPTSLPTLKPSSGPTPTPTYRPSLDPSPDPTPLPTPMPTPLPTHYPTMDSCTMDFTEDVVFVIDTSCDISRTETAAILTFVSDVAQRIKSSGSPAFSLVNCNGKLEDLVTIPFNFDHRIYNRQSTTKQVLAELFFKIENQKSGKDTRQPIGECINQALVELQTQPRYKKAKKIVYFNVCHERKSEIHVCSNSLFDRLEMDGVHLIVVNIGNESGSADCLVEDETRIFSFPYARESAFRCSRGITEREELVYEICEEPTQEPTTIPTKSPSVSPITDPTEFPSPKPTPLPTTSPSSEPSLSPTLDPTPDPFPSPTPLPTPFPTHNPTMPTMCNQNTADLVFVVDASCALTNDESEAFLNFVSHIAQLVKGGGQPALSFVNCNGEKYDDKDLVTIPFNYRHRRFNRKSTSKSILAELFYKIEHQESNNNNRLPTGHCIREAFFELQNKNSFYSKIPQKIIYFNICKEKRSTEKVCDNQLINELDTYGVDRIVVNIRDFSGEANCLVNNDYGRIFNFEFITSEGFASDESVEEIIKLTDEICEQPTPEPTETPTKSPTLSPIPSPTDHPSPLPSSSPSRSPSPPPTDDPTAIPTWYPTTIQPTPSPTHSPSTDPTPDPSSSPSKYLSFSPSFEPTSFPLSSTFPDPTVQPTLKPTNNPTIEACDLDFYSDIFIIGGNSCGLNTNQCNEQQLYLSELLQKIKGDGLNPRVGYMTCDGHQSIYKQTIDIEIDNNRLNSQHTTYDDLLHMFNFVRNGKCIGAEYNPMADCVDRAISEFQYGYNSVRTLIIVNNCEDYGSRHGILTDYIRQRITENNIQCYAINIGTEVGEDYLSDICEVFKIDPAEDAKVNDELVNAICREPTRSPSISPTTGGPTGYPTKRPTGDPTRNPSWYPTVKPMWWKDTVERPSEHVGRKRRHRKNSHNHYHVHRGGGHRHRHHHE